MKKVVALTGIVLVVLIVIVYINKLYYPSLPIDGVSAKEVINKLQKSDSKFVQIAEKDNLVWYITPTENQGILVADERIIKFLESSGWIFKEKEGSGLFFEQDGERKIVTTEMWTGKYVLVKVPK
ncbi:MULTISPECIES: hypothetical protein [Sutcliffiella]|uniref:Uncharacterized protein n=1 Tax=Sutcliffiella cohnii TaxID=33932 RepID=A0A223KP76_9BACI|nr:MULTISPECIES: hypothetical protein [Sutcliffiella]AST91259.1 hypothetical protein BC6307_08200 [Sutcliffiella cohnii]MED4018875.1 hypothetical protein [Sutcliffiella cohnii]WBL17085.1 hypothetical protein O1A01_10815 [Sutcliffiella sp. NC1]